MAAVKRRRADSLGSGENGPTARLRAALKRNRRQGTPGVYAVCSSHPWVLDAAVEQSKSDGSFLLVESTCSQVNQEGGYSGLRPDQFGKFIRSLAVRGGLPPESILLGGDHLGPFPWRAKRSNQALEKACALVRACVTAGYNKIHLDASMACADDKKGLSEQVIAERTALLCEAAESATQELGPHASRPLYVVGTEVPAPGGETLPGEPPAVTKKKDVQHTLNIFEKAFAARGLRDAWDRTIGLVVQPGVEFGDDMVFGYDRTKTPSLSTALPACPELVYEAHSTDYQSPSALKQMVEDHFAILKVGPWLTFAFREAVFALGAIEREILAGKRSKAVSRVREALEHAMLNDPSHWRSYYHGNMDKTRLCRAYSYSDRCRYYWNQRDVQKEVQRLLQNLSSVPLPLTLISQYLPLEYEAIRDEGLQLAPEPIIRHHIRRVLRTYASACGKGDV